MYEKGCWTIAVGIAHLFSAFLLFGIWWAMSILHGEKREREGVPAKSQDRPRRMIRLVHSLRVRAARRRPGHLTRSRYSPVRVSTLIFSPGSMKGGTWTRRPVSSVASLYWLVAVAPFRAGGVSVTVISTVAGSSIDTGLLSTYLTITLLFGSKYCMDEPIMSGGKLELVEGLGVHEDMLVARGVQIFVLLRLDVGHLDLIDRAEPLVDERAGVHVAELGLDHRAEVARCVVGEVEDDEVDEPSIVITIPRRISVALIIMAVRTAPGRRTKIRMKTNRKRRARGPFTF